MAAECAATAALRAGARALDREGESRMARELRRLSAELVVFRRQSRRFNARVFRELNKEEGDNSRPSSRLSTGSRATRGSPARDREGRRWRPSRSRSPRRSPQRTVVKERCAVGGPLKADTKDGKRSGSGESRPRTTSPLAPNGGSTKKRSEPDKNIKKRVSSVVAVQKRPSPPAGIVKEEEAMETDV